MKRSKRTIRREKKKNHEEIQRSLPLDISFGKIKIANGDDITQSDHVPLDLVLEILSRLPAKSIVRFRVVSKLWSSITTTPDFVTWFAIRSSSRPPSLLLTFRSYRNRLDVSRGLVFSFNTGVQSRVVFSFPQHQNTDGSRSPVESYQMEHPKYWNTPLSECVHGLVLLEGFVIWNPTMRQFLALPELKNTFGEESYLGYDPLEGKHKVLHLYYEHSEQPRVLTLGVQESWRVITSGVPRHRPIGRAQCFHGILYYAAEDHSWLSNKKGSGIERFIMSFDCRSDKFNPIKYPQDSEDYYVMIPYEGTLALVRLYEGKVDIYILKDADEHEWVHKCFPVGYKRQRRTHLDFNGVTDAGELIFTSLCQSSFFILYFDPRRNSTRKALFEGIDRRGGVRGMHIFPTHVESLLSM